MVFNGTLSTTRHKVYYNSMILTVYTLKLGCTHKSYRLFKNSNTEVRVYLQSKYWKNSEKECKLVLSKNALNTFEKHNKIYIAKVLSQGCTYTIRLSKHIREAKSISKNLNTIMVLTKKLKKKT